MNQMPDEWLNRVAGGLPGDKVDLLDKNGKVLCTVSGDDDGSDYIDQLPEFSQAAQIRFREPSGYGYTCSPDLMRIICKANRHDPMSAEEEKIFANFVCGGEGANWGWY